MRPYSGQEEKVYIYKYSRRHRVIENSFGILSVRLRTLKTLLNSIENIKKYILAFLINSSQLSYLPLGFFDLEDSSSNILV